MEQRHVAIIGGGQAGGRTAASLRDFGFDGSITLIGAEDELPYERPPLSKDALFGAAAAEPAYLFDADFYKANRIELLQGETVKRIDPSGSLILASGRTLQADRIVIATGARARQVHIEGMRAERVSSLRSIADARDLRSKFGKDRRVVLIGGGFIGLEVAAGAAQAGCRVTVVEARPRLLERALSPGTSALLLSLHESNGVTFRLGTDVVKVSHGERETQLVLADGSLLTADVVVVAVGAQPNAELAQECGIACSNGVDVDTDCRTSAANVWAVGDVAARVHDSFGRRVRIESWENAEVHAALAARSIAASWTQESSPRTPDSPAWFWTDQYNLNLQILGDVAGADQVVSRPASAGGGTLLFHFKAEKLCGAELVAAARDRTLVKKLLQQGWPQQPQTLGNSNLTLKQLVSGAQPSPTAAWRQ